MRIDWNTWAYGHWKNDVIVRICWKFSKCTSDCRQYPVSACLRSIQLISSSNHYDGIVLIIVLYYCVCRSGEEQSHKSPTPGGGPDEYRRAVNSHLS